MKIKNMILSVSAAFLFFVQPFPVFSQGTESLPVDDEITDDGTQPDDGEIDDSELEELDPWFLDADPESALPEEKKKINEPEKDTGGKKEVDSEKNTDKEDIDRDMPEEPLPEKIK